MGSGKGWLKNISLALGSVLLVVVASLAADRIYGQMMERPAPPGSMELIFPPNAEQTFGSIDFTYTARINSLGLRERELSRDPKVFRIVALGDSYTYGWGIESEQTWLRLLETHLRDAGYNVETVNLGKPGSGPPFYAELAEKAFPVLQPDLVLVGMLQGNDLAASGPEGLEEKPAPPSAERLRGIVRALYPNLTRMARDARMARMSETRKQEMPPQKTTAEDNRRWTENTAKDFLAKMSPEERAKFDTLEPKVREAFTTGNFNPYMIDLALKNPRIYLMPMNTDDPWIKTCIGNMAGHLRRIKRAAAEYGAPVLVLSVPDGPYVNDSALANLRRVGFETDPALMNETNADMGIQLACRQAELPFFSVSAGFREHAADGSLFFELDGHLTANGHKLYADLMAPVLAREIGPLAPELPGK